MMTNKNVEMIAQNKPDGSIRPLRFRFQEEDELQFIQVDKDFTSRMEKIDGKLTYVFTCFVGHCGSAFGRKVWNSTYERLKRTVC